jgi:hypothetical protein
MFKLLEQYGIYTIPNFLNDDECELYKQIVLNPPKESSYFTDSGIFKNRKFIDTQLTEVFYKKLMNYFKPSDLLLRPNNLIMTGFYEKGEQFNLHTDTGLYYNRNTEEKSRWTLLIYLNDDYLGGNTLFYDDSWKLTKTIKPEKGKALLFDIDLWHRGDIIQSGKKYWIACEIIGKF